MVFLPKKKSKKKEKTSDSNYLVSLLEEPTVNSVQEEKETKQKNVEDEVERIVEISEGLVQRVFDMRKIIDSKKIISRYD